MDHKKYQNWVSGIDELSPSQKQQTQDLLSGITGDDACRSVGDVFGLLAQYVQDEAENQSFNRRERRRKAYVRELNIKKEFEESFKDVDGASYDGFCDFCDERDKEFEDKLSKFTLSSKLK